MRKLLLKTVLLFLPVLLFVHQQGFAQCTLTCPSNITLPADAGKCGAVINYTAPAVPSGCSLKSIDTTFAFTATQQIFVVPAGVTSVTIQTWGAQGGEGGDNSRCPNNGGLGGYAAGTLQVNPGDNLYVYVGGQPGGAPNSGTRWPGGYNGGGMFVYGSGGGGGASDVRIGENRVIVAGGGGGGNYYQGCYSGGVGGGTSGGAGDNFFGGSGGGGGTQTAGGARGYAGGEAGSWGQGGNATNASSQDAGGGGGYYGGGSATAAGGGGGSGYVGGVTNDSMQMGVNSGNGKVQISYTTTTTTAAPTVVQTAGFASGAFFPVGTTTNTFALVGSNGDTLSKCSSTVTVTDDQKPVLTCPTVPLQCYNSKGTYSIDTLKASDNCGIQSTSYTITGATQRSGTGNNASGAFNPGTSTITWTVTDVHGNQDSCKTTVTVDQNCGSCGNATGLTTTNITTTSATLNWVANVNPLQWQVQYQSTARHAKWIDITGITQSMRSVTINGLAIKQTYNWHIRGQCSKSWTSYSKAASFTTLFSTQIVQARALEEPANVAETNSRLTLHPNPSNGRFIINLHLSNNNSTKAKIELVNMFGQTVYTENGSIANGKLQQTVSMPSLAAHGMYLLRVIANAKVYQQKLIYTK